MPQICVYFFFPDSVFLEIVISIGDLIEEITYFRILESIRYLERVQSAISIEAERDFLLFAIVVIKDFEDEKG